MLIVSQAKDPVVLSYWTLRKAVGYVAVFLPFALCLPLLLKDHGVATSISGYYYTGMRNLLVGSLCAISMFMLCCRGYDLQDEIAGAFSGLCALGVAFCPTAPDIDPTARQLQVGAIHYVFAASLFLTLAYFCLRLFKMSAADKPLTPRKVQRNWIYTACGYAILSSMALLLLFNRVLKVEHLIGVLSPTFVFETTSLIAFGFAWLVKGEALFTDGDKPATTTQTVG